MSTTRTEEQGELWYDDYTGPEESDTQIEEYDLTATPNDFNILTIYNFIESGAVQIPGFQRNYVWDIARASKLMESLILGLPVPQVFLYEDSKNKFLVIDGQQRLMSIYYFMKQRFPRKEKRVELRRVFEKYGRIPDEVIHDDEFFRAFGLVLPEKLPKRPNKFSGLKYNTLGNYKTTFDLRPIRNVVVKQNSPREDDSSVYEIFSRLNSGGVNLTPQEIRTSLYHSPFYEMLNRVNMDGDWRRILGRLEPDLHAKDIEILLRSVALLVDYDGYAPSMTNFLNAFSRKCKANTSERNEYLRTLCVSFLKACSGLPEDAFRGTRTGRFNVALFESAFFATCKDAIPRMATVDGSIDAASLAALAKDDAFQRATQKSTTDTANVRARLERATSILGARDLRR